MIWYSIFVITLMLALFVMVVQLVFLNKRLSKLEAVMPHTPPVLLLDRVKMGVEREEKAAVVVEPVASCAMPSALPSTTSSVVPASVISPETACSGRGRRKTAPIVGIVCHHCDSTRVYRNGMIRGAQRYRCSDCQRSFKPRERPAEAEQAVVIPTVKQVRKQQVKQTPVQDPIETKAEAVHKAHRGLLAKIFTKGPDEESTGKRIKADKEEVKETKIKKLSSKQISKLPLVGVAKVSH